MRRLGVVLGLCAAWFGCGPGVSPGRHDEVVAWVRKGWQPGDIWMAPNPALAFYQDELGDLPSISVRRPDTFDYRDSARIWFLGASSLEPEARRVDALGAAASLWVRKGTSVRFDGLRDRASILVSHVSQVGDTTRCTSKRGDATACPGEPDWSYVGLRSLMMDNRPRDCLWLHPPSENRWLVLDVPLPQVSERKVIIGLGFAWTAVHRVRAEVVGEVQMDDQMFTFTVAPGTAWSVFEINIDEHAESMRLKLRTMDNGASHLCGDFLVVAP